MRTSFDAESLPKAPPAAVMSVIHFWYWSFGNEAPPPWMFPLAPESTLGTSVDAALVPAKPLDSTTAARALVRSLMSLFT